VPVIAALFDPGFLSVSMTQCGPPRRYVVTPEPPILSHQVLHVLNGLLKTRQGTNTFIMVISFRGCKTGFRDPAILQISSHDQCCCDAARVSGAYCSLASVAG
jgi:hypothetical protein